MTSETRAGRRSRARGGEGLTRRAKKSQVGVRRVVARAGKASQRLQDALKEAEQCVEDCAVLWDDVEELSAAAKDTSKDQMKEVAISAADKKFIEETKATIAAARAAGSVDDATMKKIEAAAKGVKEVAKKVNQARVAKIETALEAAIAAAKECTDDCAVAWETVEELSAEKSREQNRD